LDTVWESTPLPTQPFLFLALFSFSLFDPSPIKYQLLYSNHFLESNLWLLEQRIIEWCVGLDGIPGDNFAVGFILLDHFKSVIYPCHLPVVLKAVTDLYGFAAMNTPPGFGCDNQQRFVIEIMDDF